MIKVAFFACKGTTYFSYMQIKLEKNLHMSKIFSIFASDLRKRQFESELPLTLLLLASYLPPTTPFRGGCFVADHRSGKYVGRC